MPRIHPSDLRQILLDEGTPGIFFMLMWSELDEESDAYRALTEVLFDHDSVDDPAQAPSRDLGDLTVKRNVADCAARYPEIHAAAERVIDEMNSQNQAGS